MRQENNVERVFPPIEALMVDRLPEGTTYVGTAGFEDRALSVLNEIKRLGLGHRIGRALAREYRPLDERNKKEEFEHLLTDVGLAKEEVTWIVCDRYQPGQFADILAGLRDNGLWGAHILLDISAMSKLTVVLALQELANWGLPVTVAYGEAAEYHPTRDEYEAEKPDIPDAIPGFLTTGVYEIVTTNSVSSVAMHGYPLMMVIFAAFNYKELLALINELTPQGFILLEGIPHEEHNHWRLEAIQWINRRIRGDALERHELSTFEYVETIEKLEEIHNEYQYTHKMIVAPTGSKFQTVGVWVSKQLHPDMQIVYPITSEFVGAYTKGCKALWQICFPNLSEFVATLEKHRKQSLEALKRAIEAAQAGQV